jgi:hypothetical protein
MALSKITNLSITDDTIKNADINSSAAIALTKLSGGIDLAASGAGGVTGTLPIANGGTAATTLAAAGLANTPAFFVHKNAGQSISNTTWSLVSFQTELLDTDSDFNTTTFHFTPTTAGWYFLFAGIAWGTTSDISDTYIAINKNNNSGTGGTSAFVTNTHYNTLKTAVLLEANGSSDYFCVATYQNSGGSVDTGADVTQNYFAGYKIIGA